RSGARYRPAARDRPAQPGHHPRLRQAGPAGRGAVVGTGRGGRARHGPGPAGRAGAGRAARGTSGRGRRDRGSAAMTLLFWIVRLLVLFLIIRFVVLMVRSALVAAGGGSSDGPARGGTRVKRTERLGGTLVQDPQCGTYLPEDRA